MAEGNDEIIYDEFEIEDGTLKNFFEYVCKKAEITVPDGVTTIGEIAFADSNLCKITLPETVKSIKGSAFLSNFYLCEINIPVGCKVGESAFMGCNSLMRLDFKNIVSFGSFAFNDCASLREAELADGLTEIADYSFGYCYGLCRVVIPQTVKRIGEEAFRGCEKLFEILLPTELEEIGASAFAECRGLKEVIIPESVKFAGGKIFRRCKNITLYCEADEKPDGWADDWNVTGGLLKKKRCKTVWGFKRH